MPNTSATLLDVQQLTTSFGKSPAIIVVNELSFTLDAGETIAVVGESGSGKSMTSLALMGLLPPGADTAGSILLKQGLETSDLLGLAENQWQKLRGSRVSMVFQEPMSALNPVMKAGDQLTESIRVHSGKNEQLARAEAIGWLTKVQLQEPDKIYHRYPHQLSGGQKQRVMIAMALCHHPTLLIADEPTTALDATVQQDVLRLIRSLQKELGIALIFITHDLALAAEMADKVLVLFGGKVMEYGAAEKVLKSPENPYTKALLACRPDSSSKGKRLQVVADFLPAAETKTSIAVKEPLHPVPAATNSGEKDTLLSVKNMHVWFPSSHNLWGKTIGYYKAVNDVSFDLKKGEVLGLVGESGCGKSTISRALMGIVPLHEGSLQLNGKAFGGDVTTDWLYIRRQMQLIFQDPFASLNPRISVGDMLAEPLRVHGIVPKSSINAEVARLLDAVQLPSTSAGKYPHQFSGGQRQRLGIARALALRPQILICDESVSALDVSVQAQMLNLLKDLQAERNLSYLFISHDLNVVHYISDRVMVMKAGEIVERGTADEVLRNPQQAYTKKLIGAMATMEKP